MMWRKLRRPGTEDEYYIRDVWENIADVVSESRVRRIESRARSRIKRVLDRAGCKPLFYWSGGKDSVALERLMAPWPGVGGYFFRESSDFVFTDMRAWYEEHTPERVYVDDGGWGFSTLAERPELLFPPDQKTYSAWDRNKWRFQNTFRDERGVNCVFTGRRTGDGNFCGKNGMKLAKGYVTVNPLHDWTFEDVLAYIRYCGIGLPPCYFIHDRGFEYGTAPWAKFKFPTPAQGWAWLEATDPIAYNSARRGIVRA